MTNPIAADADRLDLPIVRPDDEVSRRVLEAIKTLRYGSVEVTVHDGRVVQIDRRERVRLSTGPVG